VTRLRHWGKVARPRKSHAKSDHVELDHLAPDKVKLADAVRVVAPMRASIEGSGSVGDLRHSWAADHALHVAVIDGGPERILQFDLQGKSEGQVPVPSVASVSRLVPVSGDAFLYNAQTYTEAPQWFRYNGTGAPTALPFKTQTGNQPRRC
jgi:hypothetical protein